MAAMYLVAACVLMAAVDVRALKTIGERKLLPPDLLNCFLECPGPRIPGSCDCADANPIVPKLGAGLCRFANCRLGTHCVEVGFSVLCLENRAQALVDICSLPPVEGLCPTTEWEPETRYYFNRETGQCEIFSYGSCGGNENNFRTLYHCRRQCVGRESMFLFNDRNHALWL